MNEIYNIKLTNVELKKDEMTGGYYLDVTYEYEDNRGYYEMHFPHARLPFYEKDMPTLNRGMGIGWYSDSPNVSLYDNTLQLAKGKSKHEEKGEYYYTIKTLKEKHHEMTLEEVEKKLGYKIKLVTKKEEE